MQPAPRSSPLPALDGLAPALPRLQCRKRPQEEEAGGAPKRRYEQPQLVLDDRELQLELGRHWCKLLYGLDPTPFEQRGEARVAGVLADHMGMATALTPALRALVEQLDARAEAAYREHTGADARLKWKPALRFTKAGEPYVSIKVEVVPPTTSQRAPTQFKVRRADGATAKGQGWPFLEPLLKRCGYFKQGHCRVALQPQYYAKDGTEAGLTLLATHVALWARTEAPGSQALDIDALFPDAELLGDELEA